MPATTRTKARVAGALAVAQLAAGVAAARLHAGEELPAIEVVVNGRSVAVPGRLPTVHDALVAAGVDARAGRLLSMTGRLLDAARFPPVIRLNGSPATLANYLIDGAVIDATSSDDGREPAERRTVPVPAPPLPRVEEHLWYAGTPGADDALVGLESGEVLDRRRLRDPVPPRRELATAVALTFDDGPDPRWTPQILGILRDEGVVATFCVVGRPARARPDLVRAIRDAGHTLCAHGEEHLSKLRARPVSVVQREVTAGAETLAHVAGGQPPLFRAPGGDFTAAAVDTARALGMRVLGWTIDTHDFTRPAAAAIVDRVVAQVRPGAVVLLHDGGGDRSQTVAALRPLVQRLKGMGYGFGTPTSPPRPVLPPVPAFPSPPPAPAPGPSGGGPPGG